ncbi:MAG: DUF177 domain-containing protein [Anaerolineae bacterium]
MQYNVAQLLRAPTGTLRHHDVDELASEVQALLDGDGIKVQGPLQGAVTLMRITDGILVTGTLEISLELTCDRCLDAFDVSVQVELEEDFRPSIDIKSGAALPPVGGEELETLIDEYHILDLSEVVRQGILLAAPMHPVCRADCAGLCPQCGQNLNEGPCDCDVEALDPRWSQLQSLLSDISQ